VLALTCKLGQSIRVGDTVIHLKKKEGHAKQFLVLVDSDRDMRVERIGYTKEAGAPLEKIKEKEENN
jgi:hypothetical protein